LKTYLKDVLKDVEGEAEEVENVEDVETNNVVAEFVNGLVSSNVIVDVKSSSIVVVNSLIVVK
jgi:hypothetical protein